MPRSTRIDAPPRVVLLTSPGLFGAEIINRLAAAERIQLVGVGLTNRIYKNCGLLTAIHRFRQRTGWRYLLYNALQSNVSWTWLRMTGRPSGLKAVSAVRLLHDVNAPDELAWLEALKPDFIASYFFNQWIGPDVRRAARMDAVNLHPSLLPELRGPDPIFRTIERGLQTSGYTIHRIADGFDDGDVLHQESCSIPPGLTAFGLYLRAVREGTDLLGRWLSGERAPAPHISRKGNASDYQTFPTPLEVRSFCANGHELVRAAEWRRALSEIR